MTLSNFSLALLPAHDECSCMAVHWNVGKQMLAGRVAFRWPLWPSQLRVFLGFPSGLHGSAFSCPCHCVLKRAPGTMWAKNTLPVKKERDKQGWGSQNGFPTILRECTGTCALTGSVRHWLYWRTYVRKKENHLCSVSEACNRNTACQGKSRVPSATYISS